MHRNAGWSSSVARWAHNPEVTGSNPVPATKDKAPLTRFRTGQGRFVLPNTSPTNPKRPASLSGDTSGGCPPPTLASVVVTVIGVRVVLVGMGQAFVGVPVAVAKARRQGMVMLVMIVVAVLMVVRDRLVGVLMLMMLS